MCARSDNIPVFFVTHQAWADKKLALCNYLFYMLPVQLPGFKKKRHYSVFVTESASSDLQCKLVKTLSCRKRLLSPPTSSLSLTAFFPSACLAQFAPSLSPNTLLYKNTEPRASCHGILGILPRAEAK